MTVANTVKTLIGTIATLITRYTPLDLSHDSLEGIFNLLRISDTVLTSGQPTEAQFRHVKATGIERVINLAPQGAENALPDERGTLDALGMQYTHIPVDFRRPTEEDFSRFCEAMADVGDEPVLVHCAANMRVSAFMFRYRRDVLGEDPEAISGDLHEIWSPTGVWKRFIAPRPN